MPSPADITPDSVIKEVVEAYPGIAAVFRAHGLKCSSCWISNRETVAAGVRTHRAQLEPLLEDLRRYVRDGTVPAGAPAAPIQIASGAPAKLERREIRRIVAVMSGKGGVGKSLVSGLLAVTLRRIGLDVGILDADITGPSIPKMFGVSGRVPIFKDRHIDPGVSSTGIKIMSMNLLLEREDIGVTWRGPIVSQSIKQFFCEVAWGALDYLVVDLPPGTSDAPMTVLQSLPVDGVILVTTPQSLAGMVVSKAIKMARKLEAPISGIVENMAYVELPGSAEVFEPFGPSRSIELVGESGAPLLGRLPLDPRIASMCDTGQIERYESGPFEALAENFLKALEVAPKVAV